MLECEKLLENEDAFIVLNSQLEQEAKQLLDQVDFVMNREQDVVEDKLVKEIRDKLLRELHADNKIMKDPEKPLSALKEKNLKLPTTLPVPNIGANLGASRLTRHKSEGRIREKFDPNNFLEKGQNQDAMLKYLKTKVQTLLEHIEVFQKDEKKLMEKVKELQDERERVSEDRDKWIQQANVTKGLLVKQDQNINNILMQLQNSQAENNQLKKEIEKLKRELKQVTNTSGTKEVRLNRSMEEVEKLRNNLKQLKLEEKDLKETCKRRTEELTNVIRRLEKQRTELLHAFKKQSLLIDNLKKQRGLIDAAKSLKAVEEDFMDFLDWNPN